MPCLRCSPTRARVSNGSITSAKMELTFLCRIPSTISGIELMSAPQKKSRLKRRTLRQVRAATESAHHHNVYVVLLDPAVTRHRKIKLLNPNRRPELPCVYV